MLFLIFIGVYITGLGYYLPKTLYGTSEGYEPSLESGACFIWFIWFPVKYIYSLFLNKTSEVQNEEQTKKVSIQ